MLKLKLHWQILIAMTIGIFLGLYYQNDNNSVIYQIIISLGIIFVRLLKMIIVPLIFCSIITGVSGFTDGKSSEKNLNVER